jgi:hypothetical protein
VWTHPRNSAAKDQQTQNTGINQYHPMPRGEKRYSQRRRRADALQQLLFSNLFLSFFEFPQIAFTFILSFILLVVICRHLSSNPNRFWSNHSDHRRPSFQTPSSAIFAKMETCREHFFNNDFPIVRGGLCDDRRRRCRRNSGTGRCPGGTGAAS